MTIHDETNPLHRQVFPKDITQDALDDICKALDERCDLEELPRLAQVVYRHDLQRFQVRTLAEPWVVYGEGASPTDLIDVMARQYPKAPDLPSIPLTPRQRLFLASNSYEDKERLRPVDACALPAFGWPTT